MVSDPLSLSTTTRNPADRGVQSGLVVSDWARFRRFILPSLTLAIFLVSLIHSFLETQTVDEGFESQVTRSIWLTSRTEIEFHRALTNLQRYVEGEESIGREDVFAGFDALHDRLLILLEGDEARLIRSSLATEVDTIVRPLMATLEDLRPVLSRLERSNEAEVNRIRAAMMPYDPALDALVDGIRGLQGDIGPTWLHRGLDRLLGGWLVPRRHAVQRRPAHRDSY